MLRFISLHQVNKIVSMTRVIDDRYACNQSSDKYKR